VGSPSGHSYTSPYYDTKWIPALWPQAESKKPALFYQVSVESKGGFQKTQFTERAQFSFQVLQGEAEVLSVELLGTAQVSEVTGEGLKSWAIREEGKARFLDFVPRDVKARKLVAQAIFKRIPFELPVTYDLSTFGQALASGFSATYQVTSVEGVKHRLLKAEGVLTLKSDEGVDRLTSSGRAEISAVARLSAAAPLPVELRDTQLIGEVLSEEGSASFRLIGTAHVTSEKPVSLAVLHGRAAPMSAVVTPEYRLKLNNSCYEIEFQKPGIYPIDLIFVTPVVARGEWKEISFSVPSSAVVPISVTGVSQTAVFNPNLPVNPAWFEEGHQAFLPATGGCHFAWQPERRAIDEKLFYTSEAMGQISVGAGLLRQLDQLKVKTLQGSLSDLKIQLAGAGEILAVEGENVLSWEVSKQRVLEVVLSRPVTKEATFVIRSQSALSALPVKAEPLRLSPIGAVRHSGYFRVFNRERVAASKEIRQMFHYRYPAATRSFSIAADRVKPEIHVSQTLAYELTETDRVLKADLELEIREAGIREWEFYGPANYSVVSVTGSDVSDYVLSDPEKGQRRVKVIFAKEVAGRRLVKVHFEKNEAAREGTWELPHLSFPGSTAVGGEMGVSAAPGYRVNPSEVKGLAEMPLARLLKRGANLQQAFRIRAEEWQGSMAVTALSQNVQADSFHLYSLKEGTAYVSVLFNFFVTGAPVHEWELRLPAEIEHLDVDGRDVRDYRRVEGSLVVPLHRPVMGAYQLLVTYEQKVDSELSLGELAAQNVQSEHGFVQVVSPGQVELSDAPVGENLQELDPLELPGEYQLMTHAPTLKAWSFQRRPFTLKRTVSWFDRSEMASQVVEFAKLSSRIARDGGVVTQATFDVRTRGGRSLELQVPEELQVNEVSVNGKVVTIRKAGEMRLVPLPDSVGPNLPVRISVRSTRPSGGGEEDIRILAPSVANTTQLMTRWEVSPDTDYQIKPVSSGSLSLLTHFSQESGFAWIESQALLTFTLLVLFWLLGTYLARVSSVAAIVGAAFLLFAAVGSFYLAGQGMTQSTAYPEVLEYSAPVKAPDADLGLTVSHVKAGGLEVSDLGLFVLVLSACLLFVAFQWGEKRVLFILLAAFGFSLGLLSLVGGAGWFFLILGVVILVFWWKMLRRLLALKRERDRLALEEDEEEFLEDSDQDDFEDDLGPRGGLATLLLIGVLSFFGMNSLEGRTIVPNEEAEKVVKFQAADSITEAWSIKDRRLSSLVELQATGKAGERFLLLQSPATLTKFEGENLKVVTENGLYVGVLIEDGSAKVEFSYQAAAGDVTKGVPVLTGVAVVRSLTVTYEAAGWSIDSNASVRKKLIKGKGSSAQLWLAPESAAMVVLTPRARDLAAEASRFYIETSDLFIPSPGVVDGKHLIKVRPAQGLVKELALTVPLGFTVSDVKSQLVGPWRFDPTSRLLTVALAPFQSKPFTIEVETQRALAELPTEVSVSPMRVKSAAGEVGMLGLAFGKEAQLDRDEVKGMSLVNLADFGGGLLPRDAEGRATASIQKVYRYAKGAASLKLKVAAVSPEVRVESQQRLSFGEERIVLAVDLTATITRAGVFRLSFPLPQGFEVDTLTGAALNHWVETEEGGQRFVILNLNGKTMGAQKFSLVLNSAPPALPVKKWSAPQVTLREAARQAGQLVIVPGRGIQLSVEKRKDLSALDPRSVGGAQAGSLAFRLLQKSWELDLAVDQLAPSVAVQTLHDIELREGRSRSRVDFRLRVDHASIRDLEVLLPGLSEVDAQTLRASGAEVRDILNVEGSKWKLRFKRRVIGKVSVRIEYEQSEERQQESFLALRPGVRLKLNPVKAEGWDHVDWVSLPKSLFQLDRSGAPAAFLRSTQAQAGVEVSWKQHAVVSSARMRVLSGSLTTVFSAQGELINQAELHLDTRQRGSLVLTLPEKSTLFGVFVNEESALVVKDGDSFRFHVTGDAGGTKATVKFTYATSVDADSLDELSLTAFRIGEPLENVTWTVLVPEAYKMLSAKGDLDFNDVSQYSEADRGSYRSLVKIRNKEKEKDSLTRLNKATAFLQAGEQSKANRTLVQVFNQSNLDDASNEDVRVKVEKLARDQAVIALNTRRQRLYTDNTGVQLPDGLDNDQIEAAALANPIFAGNLNFGRDDLRNIANANNAEVNRQLNTIASKWVENQGITEPVSQQLDPVIPSAGESVIFTRKIQVNGQDSLSLVLDIESNEPSPSLLRRFWVLLLIAFCVCFIWILRK